MDMPSTIYDPPFLSEEGGKRNILGGNAQRLFDLDESSMPSGSSRHDAQELGKPSAFPRPGPAPVCDY
jgi:hypothetical protein